MLVAPFSTHAHSEQSTSSSERRRRMTGGTTVTDNSSPRTTSLTSSSPSGGRDFLGYSDYCNQEGGGDETNDHANNPVAARSDKHEAQSEEACVCVESGSRLRCEMHDMDDGNGNDFCVLCFVRVCSHF